VSIPRAHRWVFWDVDADAIDPVRDADYVIPRVLEHGGIAEVRWILELHGMDRIHRFLRDVGHPELSERTIRFWRAVLHAEDEPWATPPAWRKNSSAPWPG
jgi:hypothetical protein